MKHTAFTVMLLSALAMTNAAMADAHLFQTDSNSDASDNRPGDPAGQQKYLDAGRQHFNLTGGDLKGGFSYGDPIPFDRPLAQTSEPRRLLADSTVLHAGKADSYADHALRDVLVYPVCDIDESDGSYRGSVAEDIGLQEGRWPQKFPVGSLEFAGARGFDGSSQEGLSLIGNHTIKPGMSTRFGVFHFDGGDASSGLAVLGEPRLANSVFLRWQGQDRWSTGLYASLGVEQLITTHGFGTRPLWSAGIGIKRSSLDVSIESVYLDSAALATTGNIQYQVLELTVRSGERWSAYLEWVRSTTLLLASQRVGANYAFRSSLGLSAEISQEANAAAGKGRSMDVRLTFGL